MEFPINIDNYRCVKIKIVKEETPLVRTFTFKDKLCNQANAGQYVMLWIQGIDEIPLSLSGINREGLSSVTVEIVGEATAALHSKMVDDFISIRGPYGNSFSLVKGNVLIVGGGIGVAPLLPLLEGLSKIETDITLIVGARSKAVLPFLTKIKPFLRAIGGKLIVTTEDGSYGIRGLATDPIKGLFAEKMFDMVYTCGPETMMRSVFEITDSKKTKIQACFERIIRCSVGLCGSCVIGKFRVCKEGPIFSSEQLREVLDEFGVYKRDFNGHRLEI